MKYHKLATLVLLLILLLINQSVTFAQQKEIVERDAVITQCGSIIEGEFSSNYEKQRYSLDLKAGGQVQISSTPLGDQLRTAIVFSGPTGLGLNISDAKGDLRADGKYYYLQTEKNPKLVSGVLSASGKYTITLNNFTWSGGVGDSGGIGVYTLYIGCTLRDGTVINPGENPPPPQPSGNTNTVPFSGTGFPGLAPVDFASAFKVSLNLNEPNEGEIPASGNNVLGFKFKANAGDKMDLSFTRTSGNLNLGLVVLSSSNQVIYMAALVNSETMSTLFSIPESGECTIGIFRLDLSPPSSPVGTAFQIQASLNA